MTKKHVPPTGKSLDRGAVAAAIIDIRNNGGGDEDNGTDIAARLYDRKTSP